MSFAHKHFKLEKSTRGDEKETNISLFIKIKSKNNIYLQKDVKTNFVYMFISLFLHKTGLIMDLFVFSIAWFQHSEYLTIPGELPILCCVGFGDVQKKGVIFSRQKNL